MALVGDRRMSASRSAAPSRAFPDLPAQDDLDDKVYLAFVTVPSVDSGGDAVVQYLEPPAADATADKTYTLQVVVTGQDTTGGSTAVPVWTETTADLTP